MRIQLTEKKEVFNFCEPYVIAEIGSNHNGDIELAKKMIDSAVENGADCVKFQSFNNKSLICEEEYQAKTVYNDDPKKHFGSLKEMVEKYYLREDQHYELAEYCAKKKVDFCSTPFSYEEVEVLEKCNVPFYKIASMDINNLDLIEYVAKKGKPVVISTGMASISEIDAAVKTIENTGNKEIVLLHCISIYPPKYEDIHLNNIPMLAQTFNYPVGFSDHSIGTSIPLASVALGACIIEKHYTTDKDLPGWDHKISADPEELKVICKESKNIIASLGNFNRIVSAEEEEKKNSFRRSIVLKNDLKKGEVIEKENILYKRPGTGIDPTETKYVEGRRVNKDIKSDFVLNWSDID